VKKWTQQFMYEEIKDKSNPDEGRDPPVGYGIELHGSTNATVQNNAFYNHSYVNRGVHVPANAYPDGEGSAYLTAKSSSPAGLIAGNNADYVNGRRRISDAFNQYVTVRSNPKMVAPDQVALGKLDVHLKKGSPLCNKGVTVVGVTDTVVRVTDDFDGDTRPQGSGYEIGVDEFAGCDN
jgi:hypothetical protein